MKIVLIGPGLGEEEETKQAIRNFLMKNTKPCVIDADALKAINLNLIKVRKIMKNKIKILTT
jgi:NAD(P)H-hydrate repair Nnr-like enzyme with NAD(P)H-hydrate dehydratase domain